MTAIQTFVITIPTIVHRLDNDPSPRYDHLLPSQETQLKKLLTKVDTLSHNSLELHLLPKPYAFLLKILKILDIVQKQPSLFPNSIHSTKEAVEQLLLEFCRDNLLTGKKSVKKKETKTQLFALFLEKAKREPLDANRALYAKICATVDYATFFLNIKTFRLDGAEGQEALWEIAKQSIASGRWVVGDIKEFGIDPSTEKGQERLIDLAKERAKHAPSALLRRLEQFTIKSDIARIEIAEVAARNDAESFICYFPHIGIDPAQYKTEIRNILRKITIVHLYDFVPEELGLDPKDRSDLLLIFDIVKRSFENDLRMGKGLSHLGFPPEEPLLVELLKHGIQYAEMSTKTVNDCDCWLPRCFCPTKKVVEYRGLAKLEPIKRFGFQPERDQAALVELAKCTATNPKLDVSQCIEDFKIQSKEDLKAIGRLAAQHQTKKTFKAIGNYTKSLPKDEVHPFLSEIYEISAKYDTHTTLNALKEFPEMEQETRFRVAENAARSSGLNCFLHFKEFGLETDTPKKKRRVMQIVEVGVRQNSEAVGWINQVGLPKWGEVGTQFLLKIAQLIYKQPGGWFRVYRYIKYFHIDPKTEEGQETLVNIARQVAPKVGGFFRHTFPTFHIKEEQTRYEIAKSGLRLNLFLDDPPFACNLNYDLSFQLLIVTLFRELDLDTLVNGIESFHEKTMRSGAKEEWLELLRTFCVAQRNKKTLENIAAYSAILREKIPEGLMRWMENATRHYEKFDEKTNREIQEAKLLWIMEVLCFFAAHQFELPNEEILKLLDQVLDVQDRQLRNRLTLEVFNLFDGSDAEESFRLYRDVLGGDLLLSLALVPLLRQWETAETAAICRRLIATYQGNSRLRKNQVFKRTLIKLLLDLPLALDLSLEERFHLLKALTEKEEGTRILYPEFCSAVRNFQNLLKCDLLKALRRVQWLNDFRSEFKKYLLKALSFLDGDQLPDDLDQVFLNFRSFQLLAVYSGGIKDMPETRGAFKEFVSSVIDGTFHQKRYDPNRSPHLQKVFAHFPELRDPWIKGDTMSRAEGIETKENAPDIDFAKEFNDNILIHNHLGWHSRKQFPHLTNYLENKEDPLEKPPSEIEQACLSFLTKVADTTEKTAIVQLLYELHKKIPDRFELKNDIKGWINLYCEDGFSDDNKSKWIIVDSDAPDDLFLRGEEVQGSCQRIRGDADLNRCLMDLWNPEIRLIAVKDQKGKILGRSIFRLLWSVEQKKPVLFMEKGYYRSRDPEIQELLVKMGKRRAQALGLPLMSNTFGEKRDEDLRLRCLGGPAPWVYVDSGDGISGSHYKILACNDVF